MEKARLRQNYAALRDALPAEIRKQKSQVISELVLQLARVKGAATIAGYFPMRSEVDLRPALRELLREKTLLLPKVATGKKLQMIPVQDLHTDLAPGAFGIMEPVRGNHVKREIEVILVPGLCFDLRKHRLGNGGGYYDYFLSHSPKSFKIGCFFSEQELANGFLPAAEHDVPLDLIITDKGAI